MWDLENFFIIIIKTKKKTKKSEIFKVDGKKSIMFSDRYNHKRNKSYSDVRILQAFLNIIGCVRYDVNLCHHSQATCYVRKYNLSVGLLTFTGNFNSKLQNC